MPNWCDNSLTVSGPEDKIKAFMAKLPEAKFQLEPFIPTPPELMEGDGWYGWRRRNWGCKWDTHGPTEFEQISQGYRCWFASPWGPPEPGIVKISKMHPDLKFVLAYFESGNCFYGVTEAQAGEVLLNAEGQPGESEAMADWNRRCDEMRANDEGPAGEPEGAECYDDETADFLIKHGLVWD